jgi:hypothetical protein
MDEGALQEFLQELEGIGPEGVQQRLDRGLYGPEEDEPARLARSYLQRTEVEAEDERLRDQANREVRLIALAEDAASRAKRAHSKATRALLLSYWAITASVMAVIAAVFVLWRVIGTS